MRKHTFGEWMLAVRPWSFPASAMPIIVTLTYLLWSGAEVNWLKGIWVLLTMIAFHAAGNTWSDYFDFKKGVDRDDTYGAISLTTGMFNAKEILVLAVSLLVVACISGIALFMCTGNITLWCGLAGAVLVLLYPFLKFNALGDLDILLCFAFIPAVGTSFAVTGAIDWSVLLIALPVGLITDGILHCNNTRDMAHDKRAGIKTMAMGLGRNVSAWLYGFEVIFPFAWIAVCSIIGLMPIYTIAIFLTLPVAIGCAKTMVTSRNDEGIQTIADLDVRTANLQLFFSVMLSLSFVVAYFL